MKKDSNYLKEMNARSVWHPMAHPSFMPGAREICTRPGILLIADEVITAFGRTGSWTGARHWGGDLI